MTQALANRVAEAAARAARPGYPSRSVPAVDRLVADVSALEAERDAAEQQRAEAAAYGQALAAELAAVKAAAALRELDLKAEVAMAEAHVMRRVLAVIDGVMAGFDVPHAKHLAAHLRAKLTETV